MSIELGRDVTLVFGWQGFWTFVTVAFVILLAVAVFGLTSHAHRPEAAPEPYDLQKRMGLEALPGGGDVGGREGGEDPRQERRR